MSESESYCGLPGFKEWTTSRDAAEAIAPSAPTLRLMVAQTLLAFPLGLTADEVASHLGLSVLAIRPRVSELFKGQAIVKTGERRPNRSGLDAHVWKLA